MQTDNYTVAEQKDVFLNMNKTEPIPQQIVRAENAEPINIIKVFRSQ